MKQEPLAKPQFQSIRQLALKGLNLLLDAQDIADQESPDMRNIIFDGGVCGARNGTTLKLAKPTGETSDPLHLMKAKDSRGTDYLIAIFGTNFYLYEPLKPQWILLNAAYTPAKTGLPYGYTNWNKGTGADSFYFCNGVDDMMKWNQCLSYLSVTTGAADATITLSDSSGLPASGTVALLDNTGTQFTLAFTANNTGTGVLTLSGTVGKIVNSGQPVTMVILDMSGMSKGNIVRAAAPQGGARLFVANNKGNESLIYFSKSTNQEDFGTVGDATTGGTQYILDGDGGLIDLRDFGTYLLCVKKNAFTSFFFTINTSNNTITGITQPLMYGESMEPISQGAATVVENNYIYPTKNQGIYQLTPTQTGASNSTGNNAFSDNLFSLFEDPNFSFSKSRTEFFRRKLCVLASNIPSVNNLVLVKDFLYGGWTVWDNLNAVDVIEYAGLLLFLCGDDGSIYYLDTTSYQDFRSGQPVGYDSYLYTKRFDMGAPANPKQSRHAMAQGVISQNTKLYCDVLFNEGGSLAAETLIIDGSNTDYVYQVPIFGIGRISIGVNPIGGAQQGTIGVFRVFLDLNYGVGAHVVQLKFYSSKLGDNWGLSGIAMDPELIEIIPSQLVLGVA